MHVIELTGRATKGAKYAWRNFAPAKVSWQQLARDQDEPAPYSYRDRVRVVWDGITVLEGTIRRCSLEQSGNAWRWSVEACDILQPLESTLCFNNSGGLRGSLDAGFKINTVGGGEYVPRRVAIARTMTAILEDARKYGLFPGGVGIDVVVPSAAWIWDTALGCDTYAGVLRKLLGARPGMVCWVDYSGAAPVIRVADGSDLPVATLERVRARLSSISLAPRPDLVPPAVGVVLTAGNQAYQSQVWPKGANLHQEGCVTVQMAAPIGTAPDQDQEDPPPPSEDPMWDFTKPIVEVRGVKLPTGTGAADLKWWTAQVPELAKVTGAQLGQIKRSLVADVDGTDMTNYSTAATAQRYQHFSGQLSEVCKTIKWSYIELRQVVYTDTRPPKGTEMIFTAPPRDMGGGKMRYWGWLKWRGRTINTNRRRYRASKGGESGADGGGDPPSSGGGSPPPATQEVPDYTAVLREYYEITRATPWEGAVTSLSALSPDGLVGRRLALEGSRREYRDMATVVQGVSVDLAGKTTSITTGVPAHLSLQDMVDRVQQMATGQQDLDQEQQQQDNPAQTLQYDNEAYKSPDAPTIGPEGGMVWSEAPEQPPAYGFQVTLERAEGSDDISGSRIRPGKLMLQGSYIGTAPTPNSGEWYTSSATVGEIWLDIKFDSKGKLTGTSIMYEQGPVNPIRLQLEEASGETFSYSFHLATIRDKEVIQHMLGTIQIPVHGGTFYPYGPAN